MGEGSDFSRTNRALPSDAAIRDEILARCLARGAGRTICPSEVARALADDWRPLMGEVRRVAASMAEVRATQKGRPVDPRTARGPIRLGLSGTD